MTALASSVPSGELLTHLTFIRSCVNSTASAARDSSARVKLLINDDGEFFIPLLRIQRSLEPFFSIYMYGIHI